MTLNEFKQNTSSPFKLLGDVASCTLSKDKKTVANTILSFRTNRTRLTCTLPTYLSMWTKHTWRPWLDLLAQLLVLAFFVTTVVNRVVSASVAWRRERCVRRSSTPSTKKCCQQAQSRCSSNLLIQETRRRRISATSRWWAMRTPCNMGKEWQLQTIAKFISSQINNSWVFPSVANTITAVQILTCSEA